MGAPVMNLQGFDFDQMVKDEVLEELRRRVQSLCGQSVTYWASDGNLRWSSRNKGSYAVVVKVLPKDVDATVLLDDPGALLGFWFGTGHEREQYAAKALRKLRAVVRTGKSTQELRELGNGDPLARFENVVGVEDDSQLLWGEFPYAGGVIVECKDGRWVAVAYSGFEQQDDHWLAELTAKHCALFLDEAAEVSTEGASLAPDAVG